LKYISSLSTAWIIINLILCIPSHAQENQYALRKDYMTKFESFTKDDGLSNDHILDILQDNYGYLWFATREGLNRFDGYRFVTYKNVPGDSLSLSDNYVTSLETDTSGNLWIGTQNGLNKYNYSKNCFEVITHDEYNDNTLTDNHIRDLLADKNGNLWIETLDGVLHKYVAGSNEFSYYPHEQITTIMYDYHDIYISSNDYLWIGGRDMGPYRFDPEKEKFNFLKADSENPKRKRDNDVACFYEDSQNNFWITATDGVYRFNKRDNYFKKFIGISTYDVVEDKEKNIWFASRSGLLKFNPQSGKLIQFQHDHNNPNSVVSNKLNIVYEDRTGNIWIGTDNGISKYSPYKYKFRHIYHIPGNENTISSDAVTTVIQDKKNRIWVGTNSSGLNKIDPETWEVKPYQTDPEKPNSLSADNISDLYEDRNRNIWIGLWRGIGFNKLNTETGKFKLYSYTPKSQKNDWYNDFTEDSLGNLWVGFWGARGVRKFNRSTGKFSELSFNPRRLPYRDEISDLYFDRNMNALLILSKNKIFKKNLEHESYDIITTGNIREIIKEDSVHYWIVRNKDLILYNTNSNEIHSFHFGENSVLNNSNIQSLEIINKGTLVIGTSNGLYFAGSDYDDISTKDTVPLLKGKNIRNLYKDKSQVLWVGTNDGLFYYDEQLKQAQRLRLKDDSDNLSVISLMEDSNQQLWVGTDDGLYRLGKDRESKRYYQTWRNSQLSLSGNIINTLLESRKGNIYIGTNHGLDVYLPEENKMIHYTSAGNRGLVDDKILSLAEDNMNNLWIGTSIGMCLLNPQEKTFQPKNLPDEHSVSSRLTTVLFADSEGFVWVGTSDRGLNRINPRNNKVKHFLPDKQDSFSLSGIEVNAIFEDSKNNIWVGTNKGLNLYKEETHTFKRFSSGEGLSDNYVMAILEDEYGYLWISTQNGLNRFDPVKNNFIHFFKADGLQDNAFSKASCRLNNNHLLFGGNNGLNIIDPSNLKKNEYVPEVQITGFKVFDKYRNRNHFNGTKLVVDHKENFFTIEFSSMDFTAPEKNSYRYMLKGVDPEWVTINNSNEASYTDIDPGEYRFMVQGTNNDGVWSKQSACLVLKIAPPFYQTLWFWIIIVTLVIITVLYLVRLRFNKLRIEKNNIELEQKFLRTQMNPHFIFNSLTSIQNYILDNESSKANHYLARFSKLIRLILDNSRNNEITLEKEIQTLDHYLTLQKVRMSSKFNYQIHISSDVQLEEILIPPMLTQPFVENSIEHGLRFVESGGFINIDIRKDDLLKITIEDNGMGIDKSIAMKKEYSGYRKSLSTRIIKERIENINRFRREKIQIVVMDLSKEHLDVNGTRVIIYIPVRKTF